MLPIEVELWTLKNESMFESWRLRQSMCDFDLTVDWQKDESVQFHRPDRLLDVVKEWLGLRARGRA